MRWDVDRWRHARLRLAAKRASPRLGFDTQAVKIERTEESQSKNVERETVKHQIKTGKKQKKSTVRNEGQDKLIAGLTSHHQWADGGCLNCDSVGVRRLAKKCEVAPSTATAFFEKQFGGYEAYRTICRDPAKLSNSLKALNGGFTPRELFVPPPHGGKDDPDD